MKIDIVKSETLPLVDYRTLIPIQGNLKTMMKDDFKKLGRSIQKFGFRVPVFLWLHDGKKHVLDGHGRLSWLHHHNATPYMIPYVPIVAASKQEAKEVLLAITSQYQRVTQEGLEEFTLGMDIHWLENYVTLPGIFTEVSRLIDENEISSMTFNESKDQPASPKIHAISDKRFFITLEFTDEAEAQAGYLHMIKEGYTVSHRFEK